jgi:ribosomal protein L10
MAISKDLKAKLIEQYVAQIKGASNAVIVQQNAISVTSATQVRKGIKDAQGSYTVVRKKLFIRAVKEA